MQDDDPWVRRSAVICQVGAKDATDPGLLRLAITHGVFQKQEAQQIMEYLRLLKPEIFVEEPDDVFTRLAAWLRNFFVPPARSQPRRQSN